VSFGSLGCSTAAVTLILLEMSYISPLYSIVACLITKVPFDLAKIIGINLLKELLPFTHDWLTCWLGPAITLNPSKEVH
jgi:hypothetical protein